MTISCIASGPGGSGCAEPAEAGAPLRLCTRHLLLAHDWVARRVGTRDVMPSACLACGGRIGLRFDSGTICERCGWRLGDVPDRELAAPVVEVVYYLRYDDRIKIGTTGRLRARVAALPHDELLAIEPGGRLVEHSRHERFAASRIPGTEWFERTPALDAHVAALALGVDEVWARYDEWIAARAATSA